MEQVAIRMLQHYLYCKHRWGLMEIGQAWAENAFVTRANIIHERVHSDGSYSSKGKRVYTDLTVWNDDIGIQGKLDCLEVRNDRYKIVEYKPTAPKEGTAREEDILQVFAQKLCVDSMFSCNCEGEIYYADTKKRFHLPIEQDYSQLLKRLQDILNEMRTLVDKGIIPKVSKGQNCNGCSMKDICLPQAYLKEKKNLRCRILNFAEEENESVTDDF